MGITQRSAMSRFAAANSAMYRALVAAAILISAGCSVKSPPSTSRMQIQFPENAQSQSRASKTSTSPSSAVSASALGFDWNYVCYMVNVTASDIPVNKAAACDIPLGVFQGSVAPGGTLSIDVPTGANRNVDVLVYLKTAINDPCPNFNSQNGFSTYSRTRFFRVGQVSSVDMTAASVQVQVEVSAPLPGVSLVSQYNLPGLCSATAAPQGNVTSRVSSGHALQSGTTGTTTIYVSGTVSGTQGEAILTGTGGYKVQLSRRPN